MGKPRSGNRKLRTFFLQYGYAETSQIASVCIVHDKGFATVQDALKSIRKGLAKGYSYEYSFNQRRNHRKYDILMPKLRELIDKLWLSGDMQTYPYGMEEGLQEEGWYTWMEVIPLPLPYVFISKASDGIALANKRNFKEKFRSYYEIRNVNNE